MFHSAAMASRGEQQSAQLPVDPVYATLHASVGKRGALSVPRMQKRCTFQDLDAKKMYVSGSGFRWLNKKTCISGAIQGVPKHSLGIIDCLVSRAIAKQASELRRPSLR